MRVFPLVSLAAFNSRLGLQPDLMTWINVRPSVLAEPYRATGLPSLASLENGSGGRIMRRYFYLVVSALLMATSAAAPSIAAEGQATVKIALLDMSSLVPRGAGGRGMMGQGMMGYGMMGPGMMGQGMMGPGMMGGMMSVRMETSTLKAGAIKFEVTNWSRSVLHEVLVIPVDSPTAPLPYDFAQARVPEDQVKVLAETGDMQPNTSKTLEVTLTPGSYLLICNIPGHYAAGMAAALTVTP
jgi:uncharacterized cupredoxin-like copper-binding protein